MQPLPPRPHRLPAVAGSGVAMLLSILVAACVGSSQHAATPSPEPPSPVAREAASPSPLQDASSASSGQLDVEPNGAVRFTLTPTFSKASYRAREQLRGINFPTEAVGSTRDVTGGFVLEANGAIRRGDDSLITVDLRSLRSDEPIRDNYIQQNTLQTAQFPSAEFRPTELRGVPWPLPTGRDVNLELVGDLTVHSATRPVTWTGTARIDDDVVSGTLTAPVTITQFDLPLPSVFRVLSLEDAMTLELVFQAKAETLPPS